MAAQTDHQHEHPCLCPTRKTQVQTCSCFIHEPQAVESSNLSSIYYWSPLSISVVAGNLVSTQRVLEQVLQVFSIHATDGTAACLKLTETTQSATGFFSAFSAVSFSLVSSMAVTCSMLKTFSSSMYITFRNSQIGGQEKKCFIALNDFFTVLGGK